MEREKKSKAMEVTRDQFEKSQTQSNTVINSAMSIMVIFSLGNDEW